MKTNRDRHRHGRTRGRGARRLGRRSVRPRGRREGVCGRAGKAPATAGGHQGKKAVEHRRQVRPAALRLHRAPEQNAGFDVEIARWFSRFAFGKSNRVTWTCVRLSRARASADDGARRSGRSRRSRTTPTGRRGSTSRVPTTSATGRMLVRNNSSIRSLNDLAGKTVVTTSGSVYDRWIKNCFKDTKLIVTDGFSNALIAFRDGRADTLMFDDSALLGSRRHRSQLQADERPLPRAAVRHRDQAGEHRAQGVGRLAAQSHEEA